MFHFKQFSIQQSNCAMKVGTDGVLLGAWCNVSTASHALDIGTGSGLIALMLAQRTKNLTIDAVEIDANAAEQAKQNSNNSPWSNRITIHHYALQDFKPQQPYDLIVCNPPYFNNALKNPDNQRAKARHTDTLPYQELITWVTRWLTPVGQFNLILPTAESAVFMQLISQTSLKLIRRTDVYTTPNSPVKRHLMCFSLHEEPMENDSLIIELERHCYSPQYAALTNDFYLKKG